MARRDLATLARGVRAKNGHYRNTNAHTPLSEAKALKKRRMSRASRAAIAAAAIDTDLCIRITLLVSWELTGDQVASMTDYGVGHDVWNDGNDIAEFNTAQLSSAQVNGYVFANNLSGDLVYRSRPIPADVITLIVIGAAVPPPVTPRPSLPVLGQMSDNFTSDPSLNTALWTMQSELLNAIATRVGSPRLLTPTLGFGSAGMQMTGVNGLSQFAGIQSLATLAPPFTLTTTVMGTESYGNAFAVVLGNNNLNQWLIIRGDLISATCYKNIWINYTGSGVPLENLYSGTPGSNVLYSKPRLGVFYTIQISVETDGNASVVLSANGTTLASRNGLSVGNGPFYVVLGQQEGLPCASGPLAATWQSISVTSPP